MKKQVAIMGATGMVGQRFVSLLENHPFFEVTSLYGSKRSAGKKYKDAVQWVLEKDIPEYAKSIVLKSFEDSPTVQENIVFSALPSDVANTLETELAKSGHFVFSNTSSHRYDEFVPILIPEVNPDHIEAVKFQGTKGFIVTNANCSTTGLVIPLKALLDRFKISDLFVVTMQAISGAGIHGLSALEIHGNVLPYIEKEEEKIEIETKKILGKFVQKFTDFDINIFARTNRVPVREGHTEVVFLKVEAYLPEIISALRDFRGLPQELKLPTAPLKPIIIFEDPLRPQPVLDVNNGNGMSVSVGRIRLKGGILTFTVLSHNTIRGAAGGSILNAELAYVKGLI
ncbi:aspartate-semialdehyde dehydrogenase [Caldisericum exile]|uniref:Aspartate-semialdehyde dehydrogenase n=1 Tax=Caldisericum exile (strain DSM 21853 / NBRC 104410 / AZM16c01) TaxID=511051 RepID=A0A7U6GE03_CALEA|nr:aspartate-semialdehyde dehydrogenase [Caldisericum exile]BAL80664.1 aspartate-semialdehyde dehydrogenase [Caldisericum exile AZM16c01]